MRILFFNLSFRQGAPETPTWGDISGIQWVITDTAGIVKASDTLLVEHYASIGPTRLHMKIKGWSPKVAMQQFLGALEKCQHVVMHDARTHMKLVDDSMLYLWQGGFPRIPHTCTKEKGMEFCRIVQPEGCIWPSLQELRNLLFKEEELIDGKDPLASVMAIKDCFFQLVKQRVVVFDVPTP